MSGGLHGKLMPRISDLAPDFPGRVTFRAAIFRGKQRMRRVHVTDPRVAHIKEWRFSQPHAVGKVCLDRVRLEGITLGENPTQTYWG
jgi:hypothetical protein